MADALQAGESVPCLIVIFRLDYGLSRGAEGAV